MLDVVEERKKFFEMLMLFIGDDQVSDFRLAHKYSRNLINEAIAKGYIIEKRKNQYNDSVYSITNLGKQIRDGQ